MKANNVRQNFTGLLFPCFCNGGAGMGPIGVLLSSIFYEPDQGAGFLFAIGSIVVPCCPGIAAVACGDARF